jgi:hypothetical protein
MTRAKPISFAEFQRFLNGLGFSEKRAQRAWVFHHDTEGLLVFRLYGPSDAVDEAICEAPESSWICVACWTPRTSTRSSREPARLRDGFINLLRIDSSFG